MGVWIRCLLFPPFTGLAMERNLQILLYLFDQYAIQLRNFVHQSAGGNDRQLAAVFLFASGPKLEVPAEIRRISHPNDCPKKRIFSG